MKVSKDIPLAEITLRKYEKPYQLKERELVKKLCLSVGLLQPGDSRDVIVDIFYVLWKSSKPLNSKDVEGLVIKSRKKHRAPMLGIASSNIRRQLKRLRDLFLIEKVKNNYRITENSKLSDIFEEKIEKYYLPSIVNRVKEYFNVISK